MRSSITSTLALVRGALQSACAARNFDRQCIFTLHQIILTLTPDFS